MGERIFIFSFPTEIQRDLWVKAIRKSIEVQKINKNNEN